MLDVVNAFCNGKKCFMQVIYKIDTDKGRFVRN